MSVALGVFTSDPNLLRCELYRLRDQVLLTEGHRFAAAALGWYAQDDILMERYAAESPPGSSVDLWQGVESSALLYHARELPLGLLLEANTQPFRYRDWLFAHCGEVSGLDERRTEVLAALPPYLQNLIRGDLDSEVAFAFFLKHQLTARPVPPREEARRAGESLAAAVSELDRFSRRSGAPRPSVLNFVATNGQLLLASHLGPAPMYYRLLEGTRGCEPCGLEPGATDVGGKVRSHLRRKSVVVASHPASNQGSWLEVPPGKVLAVDSHLNLAFVPIPNGG